MQGGVGALLQRRPKFYLSEWDVQEPKIGGLGDGCVWSWTGQEAMRFFASMLPGGEA